MGDWVYYITFFSFAEVAERVKFAQDIHTSKSLRDLLQRRVTNRSQRISDYLVTQNQRLFNSLVIATYGGGPTWREIDVRPEMEDEEDLDELGEGVLGILHLTGSEKLFAVDGQHRVAGIKAAVSRDKKLLREEIGVILVPGVTQEVREKDPKGFERTRRLFSTLNREAKPVSKRDIVALDEDDVVAIVTRELVESHPLLAEKTSMGIGNSIRADDQTHFTTIVTIYDALNDYVKDQRNWTDYKKYRPTEAVIDRYKKRARDLLDRLCSTFPHLQSMARSRPEDGFAGKQRTDSGGSLLFRPIGQLLVIRTLRRLLDQGLSRNEALRRVSLMPLTLARPPWRNLLWDPTNKTMLTTTENQATAARLLLYLLGGDISKLYRSTTRQAAPEKLRKELAGRLGRDENDFQLPPRLVQKASRESN